MSDSARIVVNIFDRFVILHPEDDKLAWSGSRWVPVDTRGLPAGGVEICNFSTEQDALDYASAHRALLTV